MLLGYLIVGFICYSVMISLGEMIAYLPIPGGHIKMAERFVDPAFSFTMGWNYWYSWVFTLPAELSAAAVLINYWISVRIFLLMSCGRFCVDRSDPWLSLTGLTMQRGSPFA